MLPALSVKIHGPVLPVLMQCRLKIAAALVSRKAKALGLMCLINCEDDELSGGWHLTPNNN
jgi:hypothetical protein